MSINLSDVSTVFWYSGLEKHLCGYCKNETGSISYGMWARNLTVEDYQNLIDRGWRRSGNYCYKPLMKETCCPLYTIRCNALDFQLSKSQKKATKKFNKFVNDGILTKFECTTESSEHLVGPSESFHRQEPPVFFNANKSDQVDVALQDDNSQNTESKHTEIASSVLNDDNQRKTESGSEDPQTKHRQHPQPKSGIGADPNKPLCRKAKQIRMERRQEKLLKRGMSLEDLTKRVDEKNLEDFLGEISKDSKHKFRLELINTSGCGGDWEKVKTIEFELFRKYQMTIHNDPPEKCTMEGFLRFLVHSPLKHVKFSRESEVGFGSFHQLYWLDDKLIAVGVIDILPKCVSAVYFFYDPDYRSLTLGTYGSLREVELARSLHRKMPSIQYYYMGFYIHSCPKMRYKGKLAPSFLLCPETYKWVAIEKCVIKLDTTKYSRLLEDENAVDENICTSKDVDLIKIVLNGVLMYFKQYKQKYDEQQVYNIIGQAVGKRCSKSLVFFEN